MENKVYKTGIDIGSTTAKCIVTDSQEQIIYKAYFRHNTQIAETIANIFKDLIAIAGDIETRVVFTGSAGMGIAERTGMPFIQEVISACETLKKLFPEAKSLIDIGGEDAKLVLLNEGKSPDIRMNGNCAGGTGAFIDQMAALMNLTISEMDELASMSQNIYPIASRCGVFAKTDVQNLISRKISNADISASIFNAVASQTINALARGSDILPDIVFCGGPLKYIHSLRKAFIKLLDVDSSGIIIPENAELFTALGAAISAATNTETIRVSEILYKTKEVAKSKASAISSLKPLFSEEQRFDQWDSTRKIINIKKKNPEDKETCYLGIDSGSTTTKITIINNRGEILFSFYDNNSGNPLETVVRGLNQFKENLKNQNITVNILHSAVTGYGEDLIKAALGLDHGIVETIAHYLAAKNIEPEVSFILDIGGQDIKAIFIENNTINNIEINEACSSGCGSFIQNFSNTLGMSVQDFAFKACHAKAPYDLGSRCTVFMNSKVKQALKDGASTSDISAGLAYSVIKNCLYKVLKIKSLTSIGESIVVQGGTFKNPAVLRALEILSEKKVVISDKPELMGAYGAALFAMEKSQSDNESSFLGLDNLSEAQKYETRYSQCKGCTNNCQITTFKFSNGSICFSGNKCEKIFTNNPKGQIKGENIFNYKRELLFNRSLKKQSAPSGRIGIPRILNMYENYPFWNALFVESGFEVVLSDNSTYELYKKGYGSIMADNICFPAKVAHGHIVDLIEKGVDRIFCPIVVLEKKEFDKADNSFNCPIVTGYAEVLESSINVESKYHVPFDSPSINFNNENLLRKACYNYLTKLGIKKSVISNAFKRAVEEQVRFKKELHLKNQEILRKAISGNQPVILVATHPYHTDHLIHQQISQILSDLGVCVVNEEIASDSNDGDFNNFYTVSQWAYPNKILQAAHWLIGRKERIEFVQLNSFGCGPDAFLVDEINDLLKKNDKTYTLLRIDEIASPGSIRLRLRSLVESIRLRNKEYNRSQIHGLTQTALYTKEDRRRTILVPWFSDFYSPFVPTLGSMIGYKVENLPPSDETSVEYGIKYTNNEVCYPAILVVGDVIKALKSGKYDLSNIAVGMSQTGGQCRATNYISLIKRAMINAGYDDIPVISISSSGDLHNTQPGFELRWKKLIKATCLGILYADSLSRLYFPIVSRELHKGDSDRLKDKYLELAFEKIRNNDTSGILNLLTQAVAEFNSVPVIKEEIPTIGIVGEIYIKYNLFGQYNLTQWLTDQRVEVVMPVLANFFLQALVNQKVNQKENIEKKEGINILSGIIKVLINYYTQKFEKILKKFNYYRPIDNIFEEANLASEIVSLVHQYGEGWLIPAEVASFARKGIDNVVCLQPFGCIANHVVAKGIENRVRSLYPNTNLLFLDFDHGTSKVNVLNRLYFMIKHAETSQGNYNSQNISMGENIPQEKEATVL